MYIHFDSSFGITKSPKKSFTFILSTIFKNDMVTRAAFKIVAGSLGARGAFKIVACFSS